MNIVTKIQQVGVISQQAFKIEAGEHTLTLIYFSPFKMIVTLLLLVKKLLN